jgi:hypothetical protein
VVSFCSFLSRTILETSEANLRISFGNLVNSLFSIKGASWRDLGGGDRLLLACRFSPQGVGLYSCFCCFFVSFDFLLWNLSSFLAASFLSGSIVYIPRK